MLRIQYGTFDGTKESDERQITPSSARSPSTSIWKVVCGISLLLSAAGLYSVRRETVITEAKLSHFTLDINKTSQVPLPESTISMIEEYSKKGIENVCDMPSKV